MRFRFCGDLDAPDWLLADIDLLSKLVSSFLIEWPFLRDSHQSHC